MVTIKTTFLMSLVACGLVVCSIAYYSNSTAVESGLLSEWQLAKIYGGQDCEETERVAGCEYDHYTDPVPTPKCNALKTFTCTPVGPNESPSEWMVRFMAARPSCSNDTEINYYTYPAGPSAKGADSVVVWGSPIHCHFRWQCAFGDVKPGAVIGTNISMDKVCIDDPKHPSNYCMKCTIGPQVWFGGYRKRACPGGE